MGNIYKPCVYCRNEIMIKPILEKHQGQYSILCPHCLSHRSEWVDTIEAAILSWNTYMREENDIYYIA
jgi:DNA-directed RNA polymerase subunit RPC12/RpoP